jgi:hypothetical protein
LTLRETLHGRKVDWREKSWSSVQMCMLDKGLGILVSFLFVDVLWQNT